MQVFLGKEWGMLKKATTNSFKRIEGMSEDRHIFIFQVEKTHPVALNLMNV